MMIDNDPTNEFPRQFQIARSTAIYMAELYLNNQIDVVIDDVCVPHMFADHYAPLFSNPNFRRVLLMPRLDAQLKRLRDTREPWDEVLINYIPGVYEFLEPMPKDGWLVLDSSDWTIDQTVDEIMAHIGSR